MKKTQTLLKLSDNKRFYESYLGRETLFLEKIVFLLIDDVGYNLINSFKKILLDPLVNDIYCNMHHLHKEGDTVRISDGYIEDDEERLFWSVIIQKSELIRVLDQWDEICKTMPPYVIITRDGDTITLHGCETLDEN